MELPAAPRLNVDLGTFPEPASLWVRLSERLRGRVLALPKNQALQADELLLEERLSVSLSEVHQRIQEAALDELGALDAQVAELQEALLQRRVERELLKDERERMEIARQQDALLITGRELAAAGELERAVEAYRRLLGDDQPLEDREVLRDLFGEEAQQVELHYSALLEARKLALAGDHATALETLDRYCPDPSEHSLPWRIESMPAGATVHVGSQHGLAPLLVESRPGTTVEVELALAGFEPQHIAVEGPGNVTVRLFREAELEFDSGHSVDAAPVPVGADMLLTDRGGNVARLSADAQVRWRRRLDSLGGVARTPVFLPGRPGHLLVVSEHGEAWILNAENGDVEGPWRAESPPVQGPLRTRSGMSVRFNDGRIAVWTDSLEPETYTGEELYVFDGLEHDDGSPVAGLRLLRRGAEQDSILESADGLWAVEVREDDYLVRQGPPGSPAFGVRREGEWSFVAFEAGHALVPEGRLWFSDAAGLRAVLLRADSIAEGYE